jgi:hypothetical protein
LRNLFMVSPEQKMFSACGDSSYKHTYIGSYFTFYNSVVFLVCGLLFFDSYGRWQSSVVSSQDTLYLCCCRDCTLLYW